MKTLDEQARIRHHALQAYESAAIVYFTEGYDTPLGHQALNVLQEAKALLEMMMPYQEPPK